MASGRRPGEHDADPGAADRRTRSTTGHCSSSRQRHRRGLRRHPQRPPADPVPRLALALREQRASTSGDELPRPGPDTEPIDPGARPSPATDSPAALFSSVLIVLVLTVQKSRNGAPMPNGAPELLILLLVFAVEAGSCSSNLGLGEADCSSPSVDVSSSNVMTVSGCADSEIHPVPQRTPTGGGTRSNGSPRAAVPGSRSPRTSPPS